MRDVTYEFDQLPVRVNRGGSRCVVARVAGRAEIVFDGEEVDEFDLYLTDEDGREVPLEANDPLYPQLRREIFARWDRFDFDCDRPWRDENAEHRLTTADVL